jgi:hypothetical protein
MFPNTITYDLRRINFYEIFVTVLLVDSTGTLVTAGIAQSVLGRATGWTAEVGFPVGTRFFSSPQRPDRLWSQPSLISNGYRGLFWGEVNAEGA